MQQVSIGAQEQKVTVMQWTDKSELNQEAWERQERLREWYDERRLVLDLALCRMFPGQAGDVDHLVDSLEDFILTLGTIRESRRGGVLDLMRQLEDD